MKKLLVSLTVFLVSIFSLSVVAFAATTPEVSGTITFNGSPAASANVSVSCAASGGGQHVRNLTTSSTGHYNASFGAGQCNDGAAVVVLATSSDGTASGQASGVMGDGGTSQRVEVDVGMSASIPLPELIPMTMITAILATGVVVTAIRRKKLYGPKED